MAPIASAPVGPDGFKPRPSSYGLPAARLLVADDSIDKYANGSNTRLLILLVVIFGVTLISSSYGAGINLSVADLIMPLLLLLLATRLFVQKSALVFFLLLAASTFFTVLAVTPNRFTIEPQMTLVIRDFLKLTSVFMYFVLGFNLAQASLVRPMIKGFSWAILLVGSAGIVLTIRPIDSINQYLFFASYRYQGLVVDPNLWATLVVSAAPFFLTNRRLRYFSKSIVLTMLFLAVLVTGSKTGTIIFFGYIFYMFAFYVIASVRSNNVLSAIWRLSGLILVAIIGALILPQVLHVFASRLPPAQRILDVVNDSSLALDGEGSNRSVVYDTALDIIAASPLFGTGLGTYSEVARSISGGAGIAHNTYLQLLAEWGIPFAAAFFLYVVNLLFRSWQSAYNNSETLLLVGQLVILLSASLSLSLNNLRLFWIVLGALAFHLRSSTRGVGNKAKLTDLTRTCYFPTSCRE